MDIASIGGIALAIIGILAGMMIEGGSISQITQPTAALIVIGGTAGAVLLQFPLNTFARCLEASDEDLLLERSRRRSNPAATGQVRQQGAQERHRLSRPGSPERRRSLPQAGPDARHRRNRAKRGPQDHADGARQQDRDGREDSRRSSKPPADTRQPSESSALSSASSR